MNVPKLMCADLVFFSDDSAVSRVIRWFTRAKGEERTRASHVGQMVDPEHIGEELSTCKIHPLGPRLQGGWREIWRHRALNDDGRRVIREKWLQARGAWYGWWKNLTAAGDGLLGKVFGGNPRIFRRAGFTKERTNCSGRVGLNTAPGLVASKFPVRLGAFGMRAGTETPDNIHDYCVAHPGEWELIWKSEEN